MNEQVRVIKIAAYDQGGALKLLACSRHIGKDFFAKAVGEPAPPPFGAEDYVVEELLVSAHGG